MDTAAFLFTFDQYGDPDRQIAMGLSPCSYGFKEAADLSFVVASTTGDDLAVPDGGFEWPGE